MLIGNKRKAQNATVHGSSESLPEGVFIHHRYTADGWTEPDPNSKQPFTAAHLKFLARVPQWHRFAVETNLLWVTIHETPTKKGAKLFPILPCFPVRYIDKVVGKHASIISLNYSPTALHENAIGYGNPGSFVNIYGIFISKTYGLVNAFGGNAMDVTEPMASVCSLVLTH